mmetsp:Transcript_33810/g.69110  ORF Transcript_33810/g.69110 Transcript_33810/m.69110 type:complete len:200 (+) Transcript_33810:467-1066(+)
MPNCSTILRAVLRADSKSPIAPVVTLRGPKISSSAARPPMVMANSASRRSRSPNPPSSVGVKTVTPPLPPERGRMETALTLTSALSPSQASIASPTTAWPASCTAVTFRTRLVGFRALARPSTALLKASRRWASLRHEAPARAAKIAASFITPSSSAPENPSVKLAKAGRSASGANGLERAWMRRIAKRPAQSGRPKPI